MQWDTLNVVCYYLPRIFLPTPVVGVMHWPFLQNIIVSGLAACIADLYASPLSSKLEEFHPVGALI
jgi:hypothetical protein